MCSYVIMYNFGQLLSDFLLTESILLCHIAKVLPANMRCNWSHYTLQENIPKMTVFCPKVTEIPSLSSHYKKPTFLKKNSVIQFSRVEMMEIPLLLIY